MTDTKPDLLQVSPLSPFLVERLEKEFTLHDFVDPADPDAVLASEGIVISAAEIERVAATFEQSRLRPPTREELRGLIEETIRDEVYVRSALAMGLDENDLIVRRRLRQKLEFLAEDASAFVSASEEELRAYLAEHPERFRRPGQLSVEQVFLNRDRGREETAAFAAQLKRELEEAGADVDVEALGDRTFLPARFEDVSPLDLELQLGPDFTAEVRAFDVGVWHGPIESGYGWHLVRVTASTPGEVPPFEEVRPLVEREWQLAKRAEAQEAFYESLRERFTITVEEVR